MAAGSNPRRLAASGAVLLLVAASGASLLAARGATRVVGVVMSANRATLDGIQLLDDQDTVVSGDSLRTGPGGRAFVRLAANARIRLGQETSVRFARLENRVVVEMASGVTLAEGRGGGSPVVEITGYRIAPPPPQASSFLVALLADHNAIVFARAGQIEISGIWSGERRLIREGEAAEILADPTGLPGQEKEESKPAPPKPSGPEAGAPPEQTPPQPPPKPSNHTAIIILAGGAAAAAGVAAALASGGLSSGGGGAPSPFVP